MSGLSEQEQIERDVERRDSIMEPWSRIATSDGWEADADVLYWAAVDGIAWALIEDSMDTSDRQPSQELHREARRTAEAILAARTEQARPWAGCTGASDCPEAWHEHGCYTDNGQCSDPRDHIAACEQHRKEHAEQARPEHVVKAEALREAADENDVLRHIAVAGRDVSQWLRDRADALEVQP